MRHAVVDIAGGFLGEAAKVLGDAGLKITGSMLSGADGFTLGMVRLMVEDEFGTILPEECEKGWWLVGLQFVLESYGSQRLTRLDRIDLVGRLVFGAGGQARIEPLKDAVGAADTERRAGEAHAATILDQLQEA